MKKGYTYMTANKNNTVINIGVTSNIKKNGCGNIKLSSIKDLPPDIIVTN